MRLLLIISQYSPSQTPNTIRWAPLVREFQSRGIQVSVLTTQHSGFSLTEEQAGVKIYRAGHNTLLDKYYNVLGSKKRRNVVHGGPAQSSPFRSIIEKLTDKTWRQSYWPDGSKLFIMPGLKKAKEIITADKITHVVSVGLPFSCHWIAKQLKNDFSQLHWHMDIQDPFSYSKEFWVNNFDKYQERNLTAESEAFALADSISLTNQRALEKYLDLFPDQKSKLSVVPPLFDLESYTDKYDMILWKEKLHLGYFGSFYNGVRSPLLFLKFLRYVLESDPSIFNKIQFHFVGQLDRVANNMFESFEELRGHIVLHGFRDRAETLDAMSQVDFLINFGNTTDYHLPSKVVDYLYMNKPIVNFKTIENDSAQIFFNGKREIISLDLLESEFEKQKAILLDFIMKERPATGPELSAVESYSTKSIAQAYLLLLAQNI